MKWERCYDDEVFDEDTIDCAVYKTISTDDLCEAMYDTMSEIGFTRFFEHISEEMTEIIYQKAYASVLENYFNKIEDEEEDE
jgi:hypothetical protein